MSQTVNNPAAARLRLAGDHDLGEDFPTIPPADDMTSECDAIADLFMSGGSLSPEPAPAEPVASSRLGPAASQARTIPATPTVTPRSQASPAPVEAMVLGHLPVLASAWAPQYARTLSQSLGQPIALVRFRAGTLSVELFGEPAAPTPESDSHVATALASAAVHAARWLVSTDATGEPELADLLRSRKVGQLTLLTGADEAASVACYRTLKSLLGPEQDADGSPLHVRIAVMGGPETAARDSGDRLARAAETFLGFRPEVSHAASRIEPAPSRLLYRGPAELSLAEALQAIARTRAPVDLKSNAPVTPEEPVIQEIAPNRALARPDKPAAPAPDGADLAAHLPGSRVLPLACPHAREVRFVAGPDGSLHTLAWDQDGSALPIAALTAANAWAVLNSDLVSAACPGVASPSQRAPVSHVFTRDARRVRGLLDSGLRIHLVVAIPTGGTASAELN